MTNTEDTLPQFAEYPYSWAPDCGVTLDDFLKKVRVRCSPCPTSGAQWSAEALDGRGRWNETGEHNDTINDVVTHHRFSGSGWKVRVHLEIKLTWMLPSRRPRTCVRLSKALTHYPVQSCSSVKGTTAKIEEIKVRVLTWTPLFSFHSVL